MVGKQGERGRKKVGRPRVSLDEARRNRIVIMLTDAEFAKLDRLAARKDLPLGTVAYEIVGQALKRAK